MKLNRTTLVLTSTLLLISCVGGNPPANGKDGYAELQNRIVTLESERKAESNNKEYLEDMARKDLEIADLQKRITELETKLAAVTEVGTVALGPTLTAYDRAWITKRINSLTSAHVYKYHKTGVARVARQGLMFFDRPSSSMVEQERDAAERAVSGAVKE